MTLDGEPVALHPPRQGPGRRRRRSRPTSATSSPSTTPAPPSRRPRRRRAATSPPPASRSPTPARTWTMQEPYGAYTWYAVNDQPSDKALYDFTVTCPRRGPGSPTARSPSRDRRGRRRPRRGTSPSRRRRTSSRSRSATTRTTDDDSPAAYRSPTGPRAATGAPARRPPERRGRRVDLAGGAARRLPLRHPRHRGRRLRERHGDPDHGHARRHRLHDRRRQVVAHELAHQWYGDQVTPDRLARRVDERGHGDVPPVDCGRPSTTVRPLRRARWTPPAPSTSSCATTTARPRPTTRASSAARTSTTGRR